MDYTQGFDQLDAASVRAGCRDGDAEGDVEEVYWVCGSGFQRIAVFVRWPTSSVPIDGSIQFDGQPPDEKSLELAGTDPDVRGCWPGGSLPVCCRVVLADVEGSDLCLPV